MSELKPCPFCGGVAEVKSDFGYTSLFWVVCKRCGCKQEPSVHKESVVNAWNTRKPMEAVVAELEKESNRWLESGKEYKDKEEIGVAKGFRLAIEIVRGKE